jgi:hypothetical protein
VSSRSQRSMETTHHTAHEQKRSPHAVHTLHTVQAKRVLDPPGPTHQLSLQLGGGALRLPCPGCLCFLRAHTHTAPPRRGLVETQTLNPGHTTRGVTWESCSQRAREHNAVQRPQSTQRAHNSGTAHNTQQGPHKAHSTRTMHCHGLTVSTLRTKCTQAQHAVHTPRNTQRHTVHTPHNKRTT